MRNEELRPIGLEVLEYFFCCTLLACHEGRGRSPSVSEMGEKTDFLTFQLNCKNIQQINKLCKQTNYCQGGVVEDGERGDGRRTRPLHECYGGFEIPQTESALVRVLSDSRQ